MGATSTGQGLRALHHPGFGWGVLPSCPAPVVCSTAVSIPASSSSFLHAYLPAAVCPAGIFGALYCLADVHTEFSEVAKQLKEVAELLGQGLNRQLSGPLLHEFLVRGQAAGGWGGGWGGGGGGKGVGWRRQGVGGGGGREGGGGGGGEWGLRWVRNVSRHLLSFFGFGGV